MGKITDKVGGFIGKIIEYIILACFGLLIFGILMQILIEFLSNFFGIIIFIGILVGLVVFWKKIDNVFQAFIGNYIVYEFIYKRNILTQKTAFLVVPIIFICFFVLTLIFF